MYKMLRPLLFSIDPERIHYFVFKVLKLHSKLPGFKSAMKSLFCLEDSRLEKRLFGLTFSNPVGLAAGFDKDAKFTEELALLGFGFIEIGTLTPKAQPGNEKPRLFRLPKDEALINRMGFNNEGVLAAATRLKNRRGRTIIGGNIGKNKLTSNEAAHEDYTYCFNALYEYVDYFVVNVSSPNTPGLRELQEKAPLQRLLQIVRDLSDGKPIVKPVLLKIAPDLSPGQLDDIVEILRVTRMDGVIATNTTISRDGLLTEKSSLEQIGPGGLSGKPLANRSTEVISYLRQKLGKGFPIIGVGGVMTPADALEKLQAGADLIQLYTGFIYEGPGLIKRINIELTKSAPKVVQNAE
jgi:dihydroorotate dehydrogenase